MRRATRDLRFVRALVGGGIAQVEGDAFVIDAGPGTGAGGRTTLSVEDMRTLASAGVVECDGGRCWATPDARSWLRRQLLEEDAFAGQHRLEKVQNDGVRLNLAESPLARLAHGTNGEPPFLERHQVEAGEKVRRLTERARLQPRVTMNYSAAHTAGRKGGAQAVEISDMAAEARRTLAEIPRVLPRDCADVVLDVCGLLKGLQVVETERGWPRRSAKLVLRIGLEQLAQHFGLAPQAVGVETRRPRRWLDEGARPTRFE